MEQTDEIGQIYIWWTFKIPKACNEKSKINLILLITFKLSCGNSEKNQKLEKDNAKNGNKINCVISWNPVN